jgi:tetratricopeptide (TPR) repeat protein
MSWWNRLTGGKSESERKSERVDYLSEALALERQGDYEAALTSYKLALRDRPNDHRVLQNMAIAFSRTGRLDDAIRCYRRALEVEPSLSGAHYGLAFLLLKRGEADGAAEHLERFLARPPQSPEAERWIRHATQTLEELRGGGTPGAGAGAEDVVPPGGPLPGGPLPGDAPPAPRG